MDPMPPEALLADYPPAMREIAQRLREVVHGAIPEATERVRTGWRIIGFDLPVTARRSAYFAWIMIEAAHVHLGFPNGVLMADPHRRMGGQGITKKARWVTIAPGASVPVEDLVELLHEAVAVATMSREELAARAMLGEEAR
jgi:hypothetical protein